MSKGRMNDLLDALEADGWVLSNPAEIFVIENEVVHWNLEHPPTRSKIWIDFHIFGELGEKSDSLVDIHYCLVRNHGPKLYFEKRESPKWRHSLMEFVSGLRAIFSCTHESKDETTE